MYFFRIHKIWFLLSSLDRLSYRYVRCIENKNIDMDKLNLTSDTKKVKDLRDRNLLIFHNDWEISCYATGLIELENLKNIYI